MGLYENLSKGLQEDAERAERLLVIDDLLESFTDFKAAKGHSKEGIKRYVDHLKEFSRFIGAVDVAAITQERIEAFQIHKTKKYRGEDGSCSVGTIANALTAIRAFMRWAQQHGYRLDDPTRDIEWPDPDDIVPIPLTRAQFKKMMCLIDMPQGSHKATWRRNRIAILLMVYCGLRRAEVARLRWKHIDFDKHTLLIWKSKNRRSRVVYIPPPMLEELLQFPKTECEEDYAVVAKEPYRDAQGAGDRRIDYTEARQLYL